MADSTLRFGVYLPAFGPFGDPGDVVKLARRAEAAGWDGVFLWDHVIGERMPIVDTWTTLGAVAQATERILLGPMISPIPRRRPWVLARQASTVSRLSRGRLVLGTGLGTDESGDFSAFGEVTDARTRAAMLDEGLEVIRAIWSGEAVHHAGEHYQVELGASEPEPYRIPIWIASSTGNPKVSRRAGGCDGIFPNPDDREITPDDVAQVTRAVREAGAEPGFDLAVRGNASSAWAEPHPVDIKSLSEAGMTWWMESLFWLDSLELSLKVVDAGPPRP